MQWKRPRLSVEAISILERLSLFYVGLSSMIFAKFLCIISSHWARKRAAFWIPPSECGDCLEVSPLQKIRYPIPLLRESPPPLFTLREELVTGAEM